MYRQNKMSKGTLRRSDNKQGESIEQKLRRIFHNGEPMGEGAELIYQERSEGLNPAYDVRTDRFEVAIDAMDKVDKSNKAKREKRIGDKAKEGMDKEKPGEKQSDGKPESKPATDGNKS